jgi:sulfite oxidase
MTTADHRLYHGSDGLNSGARRAGLDGGQVTPVERFFTRSHAAPPTIDMAEWRLVVDGLVARPLSLSFGELQQLPRREVVSTLLCAGLRRDELLAVAPLPGELPWGPEPASTGRWSGVSLRDVLLASGLSPDALHIEFTGMDAVERRGQRFGFGGSITREKAMEPDVLLAFELNGLPLPTTHGYPVRTIVPGWIGARSVKWLGRITAAAEPSSNYFQTHAYRVQREPVHANPGDVTGGVALSAITLNSVILDPSPEQTVAIGPVLLRGWAIGTGASAITMVECSADGGENWQPATLDAVRNRWTWTRWQATVVLPEGRHTLMVRAFDESGATQPAELHDTWNVKGYLNNAWHRVSVVAR